MGHGVGVVGGALGGAAGRISSRALDLFASALTDEQLAEAGLEASQEDEQRIIGLDGRPLDADDAADSMPTAAVDVEDFLDFTEEQEEEEIEFMMSLGVVRPTSSSRSTRTAIKFRRRR